jgi:hypothetical protein
MEQTTTQNQAAADMIAKVGGIAKISYALQISPQAVAKWRVHGIPPARVPALKAAFPRAGWTRAGAAIGRGKFGPRK